MQAAPKSTLILQTQPSGDEAMVVRCKGGLTVEHSEVLKNHVRNLLPATRRIILDLQELNRMDSSGLGAIVGLYISAKKCGCELI